MANLHQDILYRISHDLGAPLRHAKNFSSLLSDRYQSSLDETALDWLRIIGDSAEKAQTMLDGLLTYSRIQNCDKPKEPFKLDEIWHMVLTQQKEKIQQSNAKIDSTPLPEIIAVREHWRILFTELLKNSLLYQPSPQTNPPHIQLSYEIKAQDLILTFEDNGIGIDKKYYDELTTIFRRLHTNEEYPGIGIGLALCEAITTYYGGQITFNASKLGGLAVSCVLPNIIA